MTTTRGGAPKAEVKLDRGLGVMVRWCGPCHDWHPNTDDFWYVMPARDGITRHYCRTQRGGRTGPLPLPTAPKPLCMADEEFAGWTRLNLAITSRWAVAIRPCDDCPLSFALEMRAVGMCDGTPGGVEEDEAEPRPPQERMSDAQRRARSSEKQRRYRARLLARASA